LPKMINLKSYVVWHNSFFFPSLIFESRTEIQYDNVELRPYSQIKNVIMSKTIDATIIYALVKYF